MTEQPNGLDGVVIKVSVGIGRNVSEAEHALHDAKARKKEQRQYNIVSYSGPAMCEEQEPESPAVQSYMRLEQKLVQEGDAEGLSDLEVLKHDPRTGLLNKTGYAVERNRLKGADRYTDRVIILIDGDDMKKANSTIGYDLTDQYIAVIGKALRSQVRRNRDTDKSARNVDILINRMNDSGGDEFIVDISCPYTHAEQIAQRYIDSIYQAELRFSIAKAEGEISDLRASYEKRSEPCEKDRDEPYAEIEIDMGDM